MIAKINKVMNKICTSLEQTKKLIELGIDVNTADMHYVLIDCDKEIYYIGLGNYIGILPHHPAWSLTALLGLMPFHIIENNNRFGFYQVKGFNKNGETYVFGYKTNYNSYLYQTSLHNDVVDSAFEIICWLKENGKL